MKRLLSRLAAARVVHLLGFTAAWSALNVYAGEAIPVSLDPTQTWVGELVHQGGGWCLAGILVWLQHKQHRESAERRRAHEDRLLDQLSASAAAVTAATTAMARMTEALQRRDDIEATLPGRPLGRP